MMDRQRYGLGRASIAKPLASRELAVHAEIEKATLNGSSTQRVQRNRAGLPAPRRSGPSSASGSSISGKRRNPRHVRPHRTAKSDAARAAEPHQRTKERDEGNDAAISLCIGRQKASRSHDQSSRSAVHHEPQTNARLASRSSRKRGAGNAGDFSSTILTESAISTLDIDWVVNSIATHHDADPGEAALVENSSMAQVPAQRLASLASGSRYICTVYRTILKIAKFAISK